MVGTKLGAYLVGERLPDGAFADVLNVAEHIIEHAMCLGAKGFPVLGIQRGVRVHSGSWLRILGRALAVDDRTHVSSCAI
jgi:hypothetical protein